MSKSNVINYPQNMHQPQVVKIYEKIKIHIKALEVVVLSISHLTSQVMFACNE